MQLDEFGTNIGIESLNAVVVALEREQVGHNIQWQLRQFVVAHLQLNDVAVAVYIYAAYIVVIGINLSKFGEATQVELLQCIVIHVQRRKCRHKIIEVFD